MVAISGKLWGAELPLRQNSLYIEKNSIEKTWPPYLNKQKYLLVGEFPLCTGFLDPPCLCDELSSLYNTWKKYGISKCHEIHLNYDQHS